MSSELTIISEGNETPQRFETKEDYIAFITKVHGQKAAGLQNLIDKDDWGIVQRFFTNKQLVKIARDQRIIQVQRGFNLINRCEEIINDVIITSLENRAKSVLLNDLFRDKTEDINRMLRQLSQLKKDITEAREEFTDYYLQKKQTFTEKYKNKNEPDLYEEMITNLLDLRADFNKAGKEQLQNIHKDLSEIEKKISR